MRQLRGHIVVILWALTAVGCISNWDRGAAEANTPIARWNSSVSMVLNNQDSIASRDISLFFQYRIDLIDRELTMRIVTTAPSGEVAHDPITIWMERDTMRHDILYTERLYRTNVTLSEIGEYTIQIVPTKPINGVMNAGARIEPSGAFNLRNNKRYNN